MSVTLQRCYCITQAYILTHSHKNSLLHTLNISTHIYITHANTRHTRVKVLYRDATSMCGEDRCFIEMLYNVRYRLVIEMPHKEGIVQLQRCPIKRGNRFFIEMPHKKLKGNLDIYIYTYTYTHTFPYTRIHTYIYIYTGMYIVAYACMYIHIYTFTTYTHPYTHTFSYIYRCIHIIMYMYNHMYNHIHLPILIQIQMYIYLYMRTYTPV